MSRKLNVAMAECKVAKKDYILESIGLGSCVAVCLYDSEKKIGGLAHIMLPHCKSKNLNPLRFADTSIDILLKKMKQFGCKEENITAKIFGGASMFESTIN